MMPPNHEASESFIIEGVTGESEELTVLEAEVGLTGKEWEKHTVLTGPDVPWVFGIDYPRRGYFKDQKGYQWAFGIAAVETEDIKQLSALSGLPDDPSVVGLLAFPCLLPCQALPFASCCLQLPCLFPLPCLLPCVSFLCIALHFVLPCLVPCLALLCHVWPFAFFCLPMTYIASYLDLLCLFPCLPFLCLLPCPSLPIVLPWLPFSFALPCLLPCLAFSLTCLTCLLPVFVFPLPSVSLLALPFSLLCLPFPCLHLPYLLFPFAFHILCFAFYFLAFLLIRYKTVTHTFVLSQTHALLHHDPTCEPTVLPSFTIKALW